jgi:DOPA 4,5-dioxygenase
MTHAVSAIADWHAHVYYDAATKPRAEALRGALEAAFPEAEYGRWHDRPVGPHPQGSYQAAFPAALFEAIVPWLALNRDGLTVFVHPNTGDDLADHRDHALWMGSMPALDLSQFE